MPTPKHSLDPSHDVVEGLIAEIARQDAEIRQLEIDRAKEDDARLQTELALILVAFAFGLFIGWRYLA